MTVPLPNPSPPKDAQAIGRVEVVLSYLLRAGVMVSMALILGGVVLLFVHHPDDLTEAGNLPALIAPGAVFPHTGDQVAVGVNGLSGRAMATMGLLVLIVTPVLRVAVSMVAFGIKRDWVYTALTLLVLLLLLLSFVVGGSG